MPFSMPPYEQGPSTTRQYTNPDPFPPGVEHLTDKIDRAELQNGKIPAGIQILEETYHFCIWECGEDGCDELAILADGCIVYRALYTCGTSTNLYWMRSPENVLVRHSETTTSEAREFMSCPDGTVSPLPRNPSKPLFYVPPRKRVISVEQAYGAREGGESYVVCKETYWWLELPVRMTGRCTGLATWIRMEHTWTIRASDGTVSDSDPVKFQPEQKEAVPFRIPECVDSWNTSAAQRPAERAPGRESRGKE
jgi:hypothetical protein